MAFKNYPNLDPLYNELRDFIKEHQGDKGYIKTEDQDCDTIYTLIYRDAEFIARDAKVHGVRVKDNDIQIIWADAPIHYSIELTDKEFADEDRWESIKTSDIVYYIHTLFYIADFIEEYI